MPALAHSRCSDGDSNITDHAQRISLRYLFQSTQSFPHGKILAGEGSQDSPDAPVPAGQVPSRRVSSDTRANYRNHTQILKNTQIPPLQSRGKWRRSIYHTEPQNPRAPTPV